nr:hypothetical protein GCM10025699_54010 [Microbacterium flavescens]
MFGILIAGYYLVGRQRIAVDDLFTMGPAGRYWYRGGVNLNAVRALVASGLVSVAVAVVPALVVDLGGPSVTWISDFSWFVGCGLGLVAFRELERRRPRMPSPSADEAGVDDGTVHPTV